MFSVNDFFSKVLNLLLIITVMRSPIHTDLKFLECCLMMGQLLKTTSGEVETSIFIIIIIITYYVQAK